jgi:hypothetical protein
VTVPAPSDHTNDGLHTIRYHAVDTVGDRQVGYNVCTVTITRTLGGGLCVTPRPRGAGPQD